MLSNSDKKSLEEIHRLLLKLEKSSRDFSFSEAELSELKIKIKALQESSQPDVQRLAATENHLTASMTLKHFVSFIIPFERLLNKALKDDDFLIEEKDRLLAKQDPLPLVFVLDNIRSAFNVGALFRTAECLAVEKIFLCGYTPLPTQIKVEKTAMGTHGFLPWQEFSKIVDCLQELKRLGYRIIALETSPQALEIYENFDAVPTALVIGNERFGLGPEVLKLMDEVRIIPLRGRKNSLNVGVAAAVAGFEWMRQWQKK